MELTPLNVTVEVVPQRRFFINGYSWNIYDETDRVEWHGYRGLHGWLWNMKSTMWMVKFLFRLRYFPFKPKE